MFLERESSAAGVGRPESEGTLSYTRNGRAAENFVPASLIRTLGLSGIRRWLHSPPRLPTTTLSSRFKTSFLTFHESLASFFHGSNATNEDLLFGNGGGCSSILLDAEGSEIANLNIFLKSIDFEQEVLSWIILQGDDEDSIEYHRARLQKDKLIKTSSKNQHPIM